MKGLRTFFKTLFFLIVCVAGAIQLYKFYKEDKIIDGPIPIKETKLVLESVREFIGTKQFQKAVQICESILKSPEKTPAMEAEALLNLKVIQKHGFEVPSHPKLTQEISLKQLEGSDTFFKKIQQQEIKVTGNGLYPPNKPAHQGKLMAKEAARVDGYRKILEAIKGVSINGRVSVSDVMVQDTVESRVSGVVQGAKVVATRDFPEEQRVEIDMVISGENLLATLNQ